MTIKGNAFTGDVENQFRIVARFLGAEPGAVSVKGGRLHHFERPEKHQTVIASSHSDCQEKDAAIRVGSLQSLEQGHAHLENLSLVPICFVTIVN